MLHSYITWPSNACEITLCRASTNSQRLTAKPAREELPKFCACTGPVGTVLGAVYVECGGQTWPKKC